MKRLLLPVLVLSVAFVLYGCSGGTSEDSANVALRSGQSSSTSASPNATQAASTTVIRPLVIITDAGIDSADEPASPSTSVGAVDSIAPTSSTGSTPTTMSQTSTAGTPSTTIIATTTKPSPTTKASTTTAPAAPPSTTAGDGSNPIVVPVSFLAEATGSGAARCKWVDLHSIPAPVNPGYQGESIDDQVITGDELWEITFYVMLYANCERQARGLEPFAGYPADKQLAMQQTVLGINTSHGRFGERAEIAGGLAAEGHGGGPLTGETMPADSTEDDDGNGTWSASEIARRSASGNQNNDGAGLVDHGDAMTSTKYSCIFSAASLGPTADHRVDIIIFYGNRC